MLHARSTAQRGVGMYVLARIKLFIDQHISSKGGTAVAMPALAWPTRAPGTAGHELNCIATSFITSPHV